MDPFPHHYAVAARAAEEGEVTLESAGLPSLASAGPREFGGPGNLWSPETLLLGALSDCFILTFRAVARASKLPWGSLRVEVEGTLDRVERVTQFTAFRLRATLALPAGGDSALAERLLEKSERGCLISSSLKAPVQLEASVEVA
jgi:organic hydroperoxide reductase OsmC/OhrA